MLHTPVAGRLYHHLHGCGAVDSLLLRADAEVRGQDGVAHAGVAGHDSHRNAGSGVKHLPQWRKYPVGTVYFV